MHFLCLPILTSYIFFPVQELNSSGRNLFLHRIRILCSISIFFWYIEKVYYTIIVHYSKTLDNWSFHEIKISILAKTNLWEVLV